MNTPWGPSQQTETIAPGIVRVSTAGHGGLQLAPHVWRRIIELFPNQPRYAPDGWLEEDCDWALAALAWPNLFTPRDCYYALRSFGPGAYGFRVLAWLETPAAEAVKARAAEYEKDRMKRHPFPQHCESRFDEGQCGGVFDGRGVVSDADPGL